MPLSRAPIDKNRYGFGQQSAAARLVEAQRKRRRIGLFAVAGVAALIFSATWNPPTGSVHAYTNASDFKAERDSGCTNSGEGCHGSESSYRDFNDYHPNAECTDCHEYQGVGCIPCHSPKNHECQVCHDGTMKQAPDRVRLSDPYPRGHYRETTHTAMGTDMKRAVVSANGGKAKALCSDCHSRDLMNAHIGVPPVAGSEYGPEVGCGECHNDVRSFGQAEVLSDWRKRACEDCHRVGSSTPMHDVRVVAGTKATSAEGCGSTGAGCHQGSDLHALHPNRPVDCTGSSADGEPGCHDLEIEAHKPEMKSCGAEKNCHATYANTGFSHKHDAEVHSPEGSVPAAGRVGGAACGDCHQMEPDGRSLVTEHERPSASRAQPDVCRACHSAAASQASIASGWRVKDAGGACAACHGREGLEAPHGADVTKEHVATQFDEDGDVSETACVRSGCHATADLTKLHPGGCTAEGCHTNRGSIFGLGITSCGGKDAERSCHTDSHAAADGNDPENHLAGTKQRDAVLEDSSSGTKTACGACHSMFLGTEHSRSSSSLSAGSGTLCTRCHDRSSATRTAIREEWPSKASAQACGACHGTAEVPEPHLASDVSHGMTELRADDTVDPNACSTRGCHVSDDARVLHAAAGCTVAACHGAAGDILGTGVLTCGGTGTNAACHPGISASDHLIDHSADLTGTVGGIEYSNAENVGCFGCHSSDLRAEHSTALISGSMEGGGGSACRVCHADSRDDSSGAYANVWAVRSAIARGDKRCVACHKSGDAHDGIAIASAHKDISTADRLPVGKVWSDPIDDWKAALASPTGSGHNVLSGAYLGSPDRLFPVTSALVDGVTYRWNLPPNEGDTLWLDPVRYPEADTAEKIAHLKLACSDCHANADRASGPQGAAVPVVIDPAFSQTEYSTPSNALRSQFAATGTQRVVCMKCHTMLEGSVPGTDTPGGNPVHAQHAEHPGFSATNRLRYGERCIECHVRIPHAWRHPRLLIKTVDTTQSAGDEFPYVRKNHDGLAGILLGDILTPDDLTADRCATGGCHGSHSASTHPMPGDVPAASYWP